MLHPFIPYALSKHDVDKFFIVNGSVIVPVRGIYQSHHLMLRKWIANMGHEEFELNSVNCPAAVFVKGSEGKPHNLLIVTGSHLVCHHLAKLRELYTSSVVDVVLIHQLKNFTLCWI